MKRDWDILGIGTAAVDDLLYIDQFPQPDSKVGVKNAIRQGGGQTATAITTAARQGAITAFCCRLGWDELSQFTINELEKEGVDCSPCIRDQEGSPYHSTIIVAASPCTRTILHSGGNVSPPSEAISWNMVRHARVLLLDDNSRKAGIKAAQIARSLNIPIVADIEIDPPDEVTELLPLVDHLIINSEYGELLSGKKEYDEMAETLCTPNRSVCVITCGEEGCWYSEKGTPAQHIPAFNVSVEDTTGCGDVFHGAYAAALARGSDIRTAVIVASASAAIKATQPGGRSGIPTLPDVETFILKNFTA